MPVIRKVLIPLGILLLLAWYLLFSIATISYSAKG